MPNISLCPYFVPDLTPEPKNGRYKLIFVGESPHTEEIKQNKDDRTPFRGESGIRFWQELANLLPHHVDVKHLNRSVLEEFCWKNDIAVLNAIQYPLKIKNSTNVLGFSNDKKSQDYYVKQAFRLSGSGASGSNLRKHICHLAEPLNRIVHRCEVIIALGNDAHWFTTHACIRIGTETEVLRVPHPFSWIKQVKNKEQATLAIAQALKSNNRGAVPN